MRDIDSIYVPRWFDLIDRIIRAAVFVGLVFILIRIGVEISHGRIAQIREQQQKYPHCERLGDPVRAAECVMAAEQEAR